MSTAAAAIARERTTSAVAIAPPAQSSSPSGSCASTWYIWPTRKIEAPNERTPTRYSASPTRGRLPVRSRSWKPAAYEPATTAVSSASRTASLSSSQLAATKPITPKPTASAPITASAVVALPRRSSR